MDGTIQHYGVLGMKWGVKKNPSRTYAKAKKEMEKRMAAYERSSAKSTAARRRLNTQGQGLRKLEENRTNTLNNLDAAKEAYNRIAAVDRKSISIFKRGIYDKAVANAADKVKKMEETITKSQLAEAKLRMEVQKNNRKTKRLERKTNRKQRKMDRFAVAMNATFKDVPQDAIDRGEELFRQMQRPERR